MKNRDRLEVVYENVTDVLAQGNDGFAILRRVGFGASDSSILLGVNPFPDGNIETLIKQKLSTEVSAQEQAIAQMVSVRKGTDLEPIILAKFEKQFGRVCGEVAKPRDMYRIVDTPLTVNYDGITEVGDHRVPVECKFISTYGRKYYNFNKAVDDILSVRELSNLGDEVSSLYINKRAEEAGIPVYYYTQMQQQLYGLNADFGYLTALDDKEWELKTFIIVADIKVQNLLLQKAEEAWAIIEAHRRS